MGLIFVSVFMSLSLSLGETCKKFDFDWVGSLKDPQLSEVSGIAVSGQQGEVIWAHNDSGDQARFFAMTLKGKKLGRFNIKGAENIDWEDMALAKCPEGLGGDCLYFSDSGNNDFKREDLQIYVVREPKVNGKNLTTEVDLLKKYTIELEGGPQNVESLVITPDGKYFYLLSKSDARYKDFRGEEGVSYIFGNSFSDQKLILAKKVGSFDFFAMPEFSESNKTEKHWDNSFGWLTGATFSPDGQKLALVTYGLVLEFEFHGWDKLGSYTISELPSTPQTEAIAYIDNNRLITVSEYRHQPIYLLTCP